ncbi:MAG: hypothetical protein ACKPKO_35040, partial [Candidatus Fonsibacter sp.]
RHQKCCKWVGRWQFGFYKVPSNTSFHTAALAAPLSSFVMCPLAVYTDTRTMQLCQHAACAPQGIVDEICNEVSLSL